MQKTNNDVKKRQETGEKKRVRRDKLQKGKEEYEVENENREDGKRTREEISRGSSLLHTAVRGQKLQRILGMWLATVRREPYKKGEGKGKMYIGERKRKQQYEIQRKKNESK